MGTFTRRTGSASATIATSGTQSTGIQCDDFASGFLRFDGVTGTAVTFERQHKYDNSPSWQAIKDTEGVAYTITNLAAGEWFEIPVAVVMGSDSFRVVSNGTEASERTISFIFGA